MWAARARLLVACLWAGSLWAVGYIVAPTLLASLHDNVLAGTIVGFLLRTEAWVAMACAAVLLLLVRGQGRQLTGLVIAMLACALVMYVGIQPVMANLKEAAGPQGLKGSPQAATFGILHGVSQVFYLIESVLGAVLVVRIR